MSAGQDNQPSDLQAEAEHWLASHGKSGEWLRAAIAASRETPESAVRLVNGSVFLRHPDVARRLGRDPSETLRLLDAAGWIETDLRASLRKVQEIDGMRGILLNGKASRCWLALTGGTNTASSCSLNGIEGPEKTALNRQVNAETDLIEPISAQQSQSVPTAPMKRACPEPGRPPIPPDGESEPGSAKDLIRRIRERQGVPRPITEDSDWLSVLNSVLDWYVALHPELTRSRLVVALHRHPGVQLQGNTLLIPRQEAG